MITKISASDVDEDSFLEYNLNPPNNHFEIGRFSGILYLKKSLDYELMHEIELGIQVNIFFTIKHIKIFLGI